MVKGWGPGRGGGGVGFVLSADVLVRTGLQRMIGGVCHKRLRGVVDDVKSECWACGDGGVGFGLCDGAWVCWGVREEGGGGEQSADGGGL